MKGGKKKKPIALKTKPQSKHNHNKDQLPLTDIDIIGSIDQVDRTTDQPSNLLQESTQKPPEKTVISSRTLKSQSKDLQERETDVQVVDIETDGRVDMETDGKTKPRSRKRKTATTAEKPRKGKKNSGPSQKQHRVKEKTPKSANSQDSNKKAESQTQEKTKGPHTNRAEQTNFNPAYVRELARRFPDEYWNEMDPVARSTLLPLEKEKQTLSSHPQNKPEITLMESHISDKAPILGLQISKTGDLLATFSTLGLVKIWDTTTFELLQELRDFHEENFDEFYVGQFSRDDRLIVTGGKLKDKKRWSYNDDDNHILPCPIKIFDVVAGNVVAKLEGHEEEVLCIKAVRFKGENYYLSTSQDGYIIRWHMDHDWTGLISMQRMNDGITCMAFTVSMVPNTGNKYFLGACDEHIRLYDFEQCTLLQTFSDMYSSYCDCGKFIRHFYQDQEENEKGDGIYFISRGVELLDSEGNTIASRPNTCTLHRLIVPKRKNGKFELREIRRYQHDEFVANSWLMKITSNGTYLLAPTLNGKIFFFDLLSGTVVKILDDHDGLEVRDIKLNPYNNQLFTCSDDGNVKVYSYQ